MNDVAEAEQTELKTRFMTIVNRYMGESRLSGHYVEHITQFWMINPDVPSTQEYFESSAREYFNTSITVQDTENLARDLLQASALNHLCSFEMEWLQHEIGDDFQSLPVATIRHLYEDVLTFGPEYGYIYKYAEWVKKSFAEGSEVWQQLYERVNAAENNSAWPLAEYELDTSKYRQTLNYGEISRLNRVRIQISRLLGTITDGSMNTRKQSENRRLLVPVFYSLVGPNIFSAESVAETARIADEAFFKQLKDGS